MSSSPSNRQAPAAAGPSAVAQALILLAGVAAGAGGVALLLESETADGGAAFAVIALFTTWSFIGTGVIAWRSRPESRVGPLMIAVGFAWVANALSASSAPGVFIAGVLLSNVWIVLLFQLLLTFPSGRLQGGREKALAAAAWTSGVVLQIPPLLFQFFPDTDRCDGCPPNPLLIADDPTATDVLFLLQALVAVPALVGLLVMLIRRWRGASKAQRGAFAPVVWAGGITIGLLAVQLVTLAVNLDSDLADGIFILLLLPFFAVPYCFLVGLLRTRLSRESAVSALLERLRELPVEGGALDAALAEALGDPTLQLGYWLPSEQRWVDHAGRAIDPDAAAEGRLVRIVEREGRRVGALICDPALADQLQLVDAVGAAAGLALENERLEAALRARVEELRASRARIVQAADAERRRLERDLHDGAQQHLVALALNLRVARSQIDTDPEAGAALLDEAMADLEQATAELRELARGIHPAVLSDRGLRAAVDALAGRSAVPVEIGALPSERLPEDIEAAAYFVVAESLTNVARYAKASHAEVAVSRDNGTVDVTVTDDGVGGADPGEGSGLRGLADRVAALDGTLEILSEAGQGTTVRAVIPCE